jgi:hypothetical protein
MTAAVRVDREGVARVEPHRPQSRNGSTRSCCGTYARNSPRSRTTPKRGSWSCPVPGRRSALSFPLGPDTLKPGNAFRDNAFPDYVSREGTA